VSTYRIRALALRKTKLGESDLIVTFLAEDGCQVRAVAKGARKTTSKFGSRLEPFTVVDVMLARGRTLEIVTEAEAVARHDGLRADYDRLRAASVVADFLDKASVECQADSQLFPLSAAALDALEIGDVRELPALVAAFLVKGMAMLGYRPQFAACIECGCALTREETSFSLATGGMACARCAGSDPSEVRVSPDVATVLAALLRSRFADVSGLGVPPTLVRETLGVLRAFATHHVPARMKALDAYVREA
jgi:DNA repair protein RecO (recombination protein O)